MFEDIKAKESERINNVISVLEEQKAGVEEKYRKLAEEETAKLTAAIESYKNLLAFWDGSDIQVAEKPKRKRRTKAEMEAAKLAELPDDEKVIDTLASENEEEPAEDIPESVVESGTVINETDAVSKDNVPESNDAVFTSEDNKEPEAVEITDNAGETVEAWEVDDNPEEDKKSDDESWPEFPSEWK